MKKLKCSSKHKLGSYSTRYFPSDQDGEVSTSMATLVENQRGRPSIAVTESFMDTSVKTCLRSARDSKASDRRSSVGTKSDFSDGACGEPMYTQEAVVDFTPTEEDEGPMRAKVCALWDLIWSYPDFDKSFALPEELKEHSDTSEEESEQLSIKTQRLARSQLRIGPDEGTALATLLQAQEKGYIDRAFKTKLPKLVCDFEGDYCDKAPSQFVKAKGCNCVLECKSCCTVCVKEEKSLRAQQLCHEFDAWDVVHPKNMDPPGPIPELSD